MALHLRGFFYLMVVSFSLGWMKLASAEPAALKYSQLQEALDAEELVVIDVYADWCGSCREFNSVFEKASQQFSECHFFKANGDMEQEFLRYFRIEAYPTILYYKKGREIGRRVGSMSLSEFTSQIKQYKDYK